MEIFLIKALQLILALGILILLHEGGHFFFSKLFGVRVEKFFLFFDMGIGKWNGMLFRFKPKKSDTEYGIGWIPLGGYCKISGMIDESFDTEQMKQPAQPWEFRTKPTWQRLLIMIGGVLVNFLLALFIYSMIMFHWGYTYLPTENMTYGMAFNEEAEKLGFHDGDILVGTDQGAFREFSVDVYRKLSEATRADIIRNGKKMSVKMPGELNLLDMLKSDPRFASPCLPNVIDSVLPQSAAAKLGLQKGDTILMLNGKKVASFNDLQFELATLTDVQAVAKTTADSNKVRQAVVAYSRAGKVDTANVQLSADLKLGIMPVNIMTQYKTVTEHYGFIESFPAGVNYGLHVLGTYIDDLKYVFTADGAKSLGGFGAIGGLFPETWDWYRFWSMTAFLSIILAFMNILPIPALDGGHVLFLLYEMITRRKPSEKFLIYAEYVGFGLLIILMVVANLNDILRWIGVMQ